MARSSRRPSALRSRLQSAASRGIAALAALLVGAALLGAAGTAAPDPVGAKDRGKGRETSREHGPAADRRDVDPRIVGGQPVPDGAYPFMAAVLDLALGDAPLDQYTCAGTLVAPRVVLTAYHCIEDTPASQFRVVVGRTVLSSDQGEVRQVTQWAGHLTYDIAVLRLDRPVVGIAPIALVGAGDASLEAPGQVLTIAGWGDTIRHPAGHAAPIYPDRMQQATVPVRPDRVCNRAYKKWAFRPWAEICAGGQGQDVCYADSGGPLFTAVGGFRQAGVVQGGYGCGTGTPKIYNQLSAPVAADWLSGWITAWGT